MRNEGFDTLMTHDSSLKHMLVEKFYQLKVWQKAKELCIEIYKVTKEFPKEELFGITSQLRRAASSVCANIAEGFGRYYFKDKIRFYYQARGSLIEVQNFLIISFELGYLSREKYVSLFNRTNEISRMLNGLIQSVGKTSPHDS